jgi:hypothetical protein
MPKPTRTSATASASPSPHPAQSGPANHRYGGSFQYTPSSASPRHLTQVTDEAKCASVPDAWYYDDNAKPTRVILFPRGSLPIAPAPGSGAHAAARGEDDEHERARDRSCDGEVLAA